LVIAGLIDTHADLSVGVVSKTGGHGVLSPRMMAEFEPQPPHGDFEAEFHTLHQTVTG